MRNPLRKRRDQRIEATMQVRYHNRIHLDNDLGDIEANKRKAAALREQAKRQADG